MNEDLVWVNFEVKITDREYGYNSKKRGKAELSAKVPRYLLENINAGTLFNGLLAAAIVDYDMPEEGEK